MKYVIMIKKTHATWTYYASGTKINFNTWENFKNKLSCSRERLLDNLALIHILLDKKALMLIAPKLCSELFNLNFEPLFHQKLVG